MRKLSPIFLERNKSFPTLMQSFHTNLLLINLNPSHKIRPNFDLILSPNFYRQILPSI